MNEQQSVLSLLTYLIKHHLTKDNQLEPLSNKTLKELQSIGFDEDTIEEALSWLANLKVECQIDSPSLQSFRVYSKEEEELLDIECRNMLCSLEQLGILSPLTRELVVEQMLAFEDEEIDLNLLKWVTLMVLFNQPDAHESLANMELLVLDQDVPGGLQ